MPARGEDEERGSGAAQMEKLPQGHWLPGLSRELTQEEPTLSLALADLAALRAAPAPGARRDGASWQAAPSAAGLESLHPCSPLEGSQGIAVWRKFPACPGEGEL